MSMETSQVKPEARQTLHESGNGPILYVTQPGQAVGWAAVEKAVREDDELQVQSCKEDIDTLLTFAGLYSAALTALLALSFNMLQEDTAGESLLVLRQIAQQTATYQLLSNGLLNSTSSSFLPSSAPFQPSSGALRVNILWFASLIFSLSTASIGILVKQWLRAYTIYQTSSAQGRMRVRHFRRQGLETWKVYQIAAVLPFLIQLALGLFFVGLCYFTAEVHPDLGHTTLPLVAGWALFIFVVTILPLVSSHCPYKPASFEGLFSVLRRPLFSFLASCTFHGALASWAVKRTPKCAEQDRPYDEADALKYEGKDVDILVSADALQSDDELLGTAILEALKQSQLNVKQVVTFLLGTLRSRLPYCSHLSVENEPVRMDFRSLTLKARMAIMDTLTQIPTSELDACMGSNVFVYPHYQLVSEMRWILCILFSHSHYSLSSAALHFLASCLASDSGSRLAIFSYTWSQFPNQRAETLSALLSALRLMYLETDLYLPSLVDHIRAILANYFTEAGLPPVNSTTAVDDDRNDKPDTWKRFLNASTLGDTTKWLAERLNQELRSQASTGTVVHNEGTSVNVDGFQDALSLTFRLSATISLSGGRSPSKMLRDLVKNALAVDTHSPEYLEWILWCYICQPGDFLNLTARTILWESLMAGKPLDCKGLARLYQALITVTSTRPFELSEARIVHLSYSVCYMLYFSIVDMDNSDETFLKLDETFLKLDASSLRMWRRIFRRMTVMLQDVKMPEKRRLGIDDDTLLDLCFRRIHSIDTGKYYPSPVLPDEILRLRKNFKPEESPVSNHFVFLLSKMHQGTAPCWRLRAFEAMSEEERLVAIMDDEQDDMGDGVIDGKVPTDDLRVARQSDAVQPDAFETRADSETGTRQVEDDSDHGAPHKNSDESRKSD